jgi:hypothetical protein
MGLHPEKQRSNYWNCLKQGPLHVDLVILISQVQWEQINRYLYVCDVEKELDLITLKTTKNNRKRVL